MKKIFALVLFAFTVHANAQVTFIEEDWDQALKEAQETQKPIFVDFYTDWCGWCKVMDKKTFSVDSVGEYMNENYVCLKIDAESGMGRMLSMKHRIGSFPTFGIFNADGRLVSKILGYKEVSPFMDAARENKQLVNEGFFLEGGSEELEPGFPDFYTASFKNKDSKKKRVWPKDSVVHAYLAEADLMHEVAFNVMYRFGASEEIYQHALGMQDQFVQLYGEEDVKRLMANIAYKDYSNIEKNGTYDDFIAWLPKLEMLMREEADLYKNHYELSFFKAKEMWSEYAAKIDSMIVSGEASNNSLNSHSWNIYKKIDNKELVKKAVGWMAEVVEEEANYMYVDTYAALLFKDGQLDEAEKQAELAIKIGKESGEKVGDTEKLLKEIRKAKKS